MSTRRSGVFATGRRVGSAALLLTAAAMTLGCTQAAAAMPRPVASEAHHLSTTAAASAPAPSSGVVRTVRTVPVGSLLTSASVASPAALYVVTGGGTSPNAFTLERIDAGTGRVTRRALTLPFLRGLALGPAGLYVTTSVIDKYGFRPDTILRLDPTTLHTLATRTVSDGAVLDGDVEVAADQHTLLMTDGGGWVRVLNPKTLATQRSRRLESAPGELAAGFWPEQPTLSSAGTWVYLQQHFLRLDPVTLATRVSVPTAGYIDLVPVGSTLDAVGDGVARLDQDGHLTRTGTLFGPQTETAMTAATSHGLAVESDQAPTQIVAATTAGRIQGSVASPRTDQQLLGAAGTTIWISRPSETDSTVIELQLQ